MQPPRWFLLLFVSLFALADSPATRRTVEIDRDYKGQYQADFTDQIDKVRILTRQAQLEVSARLGLLQYQEGFRFPFRVRFDDSAPIGIENVLAYVRFSED